MREEDISFTEDFFLRRFYTRNIILRVSPQGNVDSVEPLSTKASLSPTCHM